ncbi:MAG: phosphoenolpyruvate--protein phosphotransferase [Proteobacteria bacterium]|nr:phosphoenolpyruvate--protein phosphotransferase [Pseudomonadota bacterium]
MAGKGTGQQRLNKVVQKIAGTMKAEVCSVYLVNQDGTLELFATEGLKQEAVHISKLKMGQGLVGHVAQTGLPLNVAEASRHPKFFYLPETGEEIYHSFTGVPIIRHLKVTGVLVVQNRKAGIFTTVDVETLQTVAMILAEMLSASNLGDIRSLTGPEAGAPGQVTFDGKKLTGGLGVGKAVFHEPKVELQELLTEDIKGEKSRLEKAFRAMRKQLDSLMQAPDLALFGDHREVLEAYKMFTYDQGWKNRITEAVESGLTAEAAVEKIMQDMRTRFVEMKDPYLKERLHDLEDLSNRLIRILMGYVGEKAHHKLTEDSILVARSMGPAELLDYDRKYLRGIVLEEGSPTAHVTVVARALGIPMLGRVRGALETIEEGDRVIIDAGACKIYIRPTDEVKRAFNISLREHLKLRKIYEAERNKPAITKDGEKITLMMNAGLLMDMDHLERTGAEGIGLFRTEFQFMVSSTLPRMSVQKELYAKILKAAKNRPVVFRTLDIGGDKQVPFLPHEEEENPALGYRAIRLALSRPGLLRYQVRALLAASAGRDLNIMFPMITEVSEFTEAKALVLREVEYLNRTGAKKPKKIAIGSMLEVPSLAWQLDSLLEEVDFLSIGTNDLMQFFFASDRSNPKLSDRYDLLSPAALSFIRSIVTACQDKGVPVNVCGEMGARSLEALALIGLGLRALSISPSAIGPVKMMIRQLNLKDFQEWFLPKLSEHCHSLREALKGYALDHNLPV